LPDSFLRGAVLLSAAGLLSRVLGLYRLALPALMGATGVGLYHMAYPVYAVALTLSTGGIPVAISKLVAERAAEGRHHEARRVFTLSFLGLAPLGAMLALLLYLSAPAFALDLARDPRAVLSIQAISPAVFLVAVMSAYRGYFQGYQNMAPTALSQLVEQAGRVLAILALVVFLAPLGVDHQAAGATFGAVAGAAIGLAFLVVTHARWRPPPDQTLGGPRESAGAILGSLAALALPVAAAGLAVPLMQLGDLVIVPTRLMAEGIKTMVRTSLYGQLAGYAMPVANLPAIVTVALGVAVVPAIAEARARGDEATLRRLMEAALRVAGMVAMPAGLGLWVLGPSITALLFGSPAAGLPLRMLGPSVFFLGILQASAGGLQGTGRAVSALVNVFMGVILKLVLTWFFVIPLGVSGAALATSLGYGFAALLNVISLKRLELLPSFVSTFLRPAAGLPILYVASRLALVLLPPGGVAAVGAVIAGGAGYMTGLILLGGLTDEDLRLIPSGAIVRRFLVRIGLWRR